MRGRPRRWWESMYSVNGVPLDNAQFGWLFRAPSKPLSELTRDWQALHRAGRDGVVAGLGSTTGPVIIPLMVQTPRENLESLVSLFGDSGVLSISTDMTREVQFETMGHSLTGYGAAEAIVDVTFQLRLPAVFWRDKQPTTVTTPITSTSTAVKVFGNKPKLGAVPVVNLVTNPSFEAAGGTVEVRRNYIRVTDFSSDWGFTGTNALVPGGVEFTSTGEFGNMLTGSSGLGSDLSGAAVSASYLVENIGALPFAVEPRFWDGAVYAAAPGVVVPAGESRVVKIENKVLTGSYVQPRLWKVSPTESGAKIRVSEPILEKSTVVGEFFDGSHSPDPDLTASWTAGVNNSAAVLRGTLAPFVSAVNCVAIRSTQWSLVGSSSLRIIPRGTTTASPAYVVLPTGDTSGQRGTHLVTQYLEAPLTGLLQANSRRLYTNPSPNAFSPQAPNAAGEHEHRVYQPAQGVPSSAVFMHGGTIGSGDIWLDGLARFDGEYTGPAFDGSSEDTLTTVYMWDGTPDASTSSAWQRSDILGGLSAPVQDAVIRVRGAATGIQVTDASGSWVTLPNVTASQYVRFEADTGKAFVTTTDTWTGGTDVSGQVDFGGPRGVFEITPVLASLDPSTREGVLTVATVTRSSAVVEVRGKAAYAI